MRDLPHVSLFPSHLIDDMHKAFEAVARSISNQFFKDGSLANTPASVQNWQSLCVMSIYLRVCPRIGASNADLFGSTKFQLSYCRPTR
jgi:hypothetical protein